MLEIEPKIEHYELGFHLFPELEEEGSRQKLQEMEGFIAQLGGSVLSSREPKKQHLSYPLQHKHYSFFGTIDFKLPAEALTQLEAQLKLQEYVLRFLVLRATENQKVLKSLRESGSRSKIKTYTAPTPAAIKEAKEEVKPEVMEKQLEEAIGNI